MNMFKKLAITVIALMSMTPIFGWLTFKEQKPTMITSEIHRHSFYETDEYRDALRQIGISRGSSARMYGSRTTDVSNTYYSRHIFAVPEMRPDYRAIERASNRELFQEEIDAQKRIDALVAETQKYLARIATEAQSRSPKVEDID